MKSILIFMILAIKLMCVENRMLSVNYATYPPYSNTQSPENEEMSNEKIPAIQNYDDGEEYEVTTKINMKETTKKPCVVVVLSNMQNPSMHSLLRKYRYDANGVLIPSSVKYFIKLPQGLRSSPLLVPLNDKAFSPQGGFVRLVIF
ncbi:unnamed protein product [Diatraea saccharalis]|uniref:Uncharacterized protein n=1 Tax=Diatraea saccharalis TaxID=40085 RepID=A0A9P0C5E1_9NEOP|nr:unnamed protein product [Diatraea saccharalis]